MVEFVRNIQQFVVGKAEGSACRPDDSLTPAERKLFEQIAEQLLEEHSDTLKKLGDE